MPGFRIAGSIQIIKEWFAELDGVFPSQFIHIGADETFELGLGQTRDRVQKDSLGNPNDTDATVDMPASSPTKAPSAFVRGIIASKNTPRIEP